MALPHTGGGKPLAEKGSKDAPQVQNIAAEEPVI